jgi:hypothetical protein
MKVHVQCLVNDQVRHCKKQGERGVSHDMPWLGFPGLWGFSFHECATTHMFYTTITTTFSCVLMCPDIAHGGYKSIHHQGASRCVWVHKKGQSGQRYDKITANFDLCFNKAALTKANLWKLGKWTFLTGSVFGVKWREWPQKSVDADVSAHSEESVLWLSRKSMKKRPAEFQNPRPSMQCLIRNAT